MLHIAAPETAAAVSVCCNRFTKVVVSNSLVRFHSFLRSCVSIDAGIMSDDVTKLFDDLVPIVPNLQLFDFPLFHRRGFHFGMVGTGLVPHELRVVFTGVPVASLARSSRSKVFKKYSTVVVDDRCN